MPKNPLLPTSQPSRRYLSSQEQESGRDLSFGEASRIASPFNSRAQPFWAHLSLAGLFRDEGKFDDAHAHIKPAKFRAIGDACYLGRAARIHATIWYRQCRFDDVMFGVLVGPLGATGVTS